MSLLRIPAWVRPHLYPGKSFSDLTDSEVQKLRSDLARFSPENPLVSVVIPAWNEENNIYRTLSSLASTTTTKDVEIIVINNNSTDGTQQVLDRLGVRSFLQPVQGTPHARQLGLEKARGHYHLCADSDTFYPPKWIDLMVEPMLTDSSITGVYGIYSFIPPVGQSRIGLFFYERAARMVSMFRKRKKEFMNVYGFNMGFVTEVGRETGGFQVKGARVYAGVKGSDFRNEAEDGRMALNLQKKGRLQQVTHPEACVFTSSRRLMDDGSIAKAFFNRVKRSLSIN